MSSLIPWRNRRSNVNMGRARSLFNMRRNLKKAIPNPRASATPGVAFRRGVPTFVRNVLRRAMRRRMGRKKQPNNKIQGTIANVAFRYLGKKSFSTKMNPKMMKYKSVLKHSLTDTHTLKFYSALNIASLGTNKQAACQWYSAQALSVPIFDACINNASDTATGANSLQECFLENAQMKLDIKCSSNRGGRVTGWLCYPRRDLGAVQALTVNGLNPTLLQQGFTDMVPASQETSAVTYNQVGSTPFQSTTWTKMFHMKPFFDKYFEPGQTLVVDYNWRKGLLLDKARYGVKATDLLATDYNNLRDCGPLILMRFEGTPVHDETTVTLPLSSNAATVTLGGFNFDLVQQRTITTRSPFVVATRQVGNFSALLSQAITGTNEESFVLGAYNETGDAA